MQQDWPTEKDDLSAAQKIMHAHAQARENSILGLFELVVNLNAKEMNFRVANWVIALSEHFTATYGIEQGDVVVRKVISRCMQAGQVLH